MPVSTESQHEHAAGLHRRAPEDALTALIGAQLGSLAALPRAVPQIAAAAGALATVLASGRRMGFAGAGSSGLMALAERLEFSGTFGIPFDVTPMCFAGGAAALLQMHGQCEDDPALAEADLAACGLKAGDALIAVSASGSTPYTLAIARAAKLRGITVVALANVAGSPLLSDSDYPIHLDTGAELLSGSTRMAAATAQKIALNAIAVLIGIRLGHVHDGHMVNLRAENAKLARRAVRIVSQIGGVADGDAQAALERTDGDVKQAILVTGGHSVATARQLLQENDGHLEPCFGLSNQGPEGQQRREP